MTDEKVCHLEQKLKLHRNNKLRNKRKVAIWRSQIAILPLHYVSGRPAAQKAAGLKAEFSDASYKSKHPG